MARILFIGIDYFSYTSRIIDEMRAQGHGVSFHLMEPVGFWDKVAKRYDPRRFSAVLARHHEAIVTAERNNDYDIILCLQVHRMAPAILARLRENHPAARFILYNWDSLNTHDYSPWLPFFDHAFTFDPDDAARLGIGYLPLFALPEYAAARRDAAKHNDLYFVGAAVTSARVRALQRLKAFCRRANLALEMHLFASAAAMLSHLSNRLWLPELTMRTIRPAEIIAMMERSRGVFDFANHRQSGYTMRFIENMCAEVKIVTANPRIRDEPFYRADRFLVIDGENFDAIPSFLAMPITSTLDLDAFSLRNWVRTLLSSD